MTPTRRVAPSSRRAAARPRTVLLWVLAAIAASGGLYAAAPWILPVRIVEGPLVQIAGEDGVTLIWYTTRRAACTVVVGEGGEQRSVPATADGRRQRVRITGLAPGRSYPYRVCAGGRPLTGPLSLHTNRARGEPFSFIVFGDSGLGSRAQYALALQMERAEPDADFLLHVGDLVYPDGERGRYAARFFAPYRRSLARVNFWPCLGNHDFGKGGDAAAYREVFELPENGPAAVPDVARELAAERHYWFDYGACRVAVLDSNVTETVLREHVAPWLRQMMSAAGPRWRLVVCHHPAYTAGKYAPDERLQRTIVPVVDETGVDIVFAGHDHNYQRTRPLRGGREVEPGQGTVYIVSGAGGAALYTAKAAAQRPDFIACIDDQHHSFTQISIDGDELRLRQVALGGAVVDELLLRKPPAGAAAP